MKSKVIIGVVVVAVLAFVYFRYVKPSQTTNNGFLGLF